MASHPIAKIYEMIREYGIVKHKNRQEFLSEMVAGLIKGRSVIFSELADKIDRPIKEASIERRIQDFFQKVNLDYEHLGHLLLGFIHQEKLLLSIDRTEWDFGQTQVNVLCVVASVGKMGVPIYFELLDNRSGNSHHQDRIALFQSLIALVGKDRIKALVMDREFIGQPWLLWLRREKIAFCVRVPKSHQITFGDGQKAKAEALLEGSGRYSQNQVLVDGVLVNLHLSHTKEGELLYLIGSFQGHQLPGLYQKRWGIEVFFQALKGRGFHLEQSSLRSLDKYKKLFGMVCLA
ncbi:MAG: transposase [Bacteroidota bacterium]